MFLFCFVFVLLQLEGLGVFARCAGASSTRWDAGIAPVVELQQLRQPHHVEVGMGGY